MKSKKTCLIFLLVVNVAFAKNLFVGEGILGDARKALTEVGYGPCQEVADTGPIPTTAVVTKSFRCQDSIQFVVSMVEKKGQLSHLSAVGLWVAPESKNAIPQATAKKFMERLLEATEAHLGVKCVATGEKYREGGSTMVRCTPKLKNKAPVWNVRYTELDKFPVDATNRTAALDFQFFLEPEKK